MSKKILIVEDDDDLLEMLVSYLTSDGYTAITCKTSASCLDYLEKIDVDLILQDRILGGEDGLALLEEIRKKTDIPVIMMSGRGDPPDRILGIEKGADDYIAKPFYPKELVVRINAILKRSAKVSENKPSNETISFGDWTMNTNSYAVTNKAGHDAGLTTAEFRLLERLVGAQNQVLTREQLLDTLSQYDADIFDRAVDIQISRIRKKLKDDPQAPQYIRTVRGVGYIFIACTG